MQDLDPLDRLSYTSLYIVINIVVTHFFLVLLLDEDTIYSSKNVIKYSFSAWENTFCSGRLSLSLGQ